MASEGLSAVEAYVSASKPTLSFSSIEVHDRAIEAIATSLPYAKGKAVAMIVSVQQKTPSFPPKQNGTMVKEPSTPSLAPLVAEENSPAPIVQVIPHLPLDRRLSRDQRKLH